MPQDPSSSTTERRLAAILSADVVGYSRLMAEDEDATVRTLTAYREQMGVLIDQHRGRVVDAPGDNLLAEFPTATDAVRASAEIQRVILARNAAVPEGRKMEFRIGVHVGEVRVEGERIYGDSVNIAARLEGLAESGGICISEDVLHQVQRKVELDFDDLGEQSIKNIPDPVHVYRVRLESGKRPTVDHAKSAGVGPTRGPAIAVLPFDNLSGDPEQEYFADGIAEDLITRLSQQPFGAVIARNSSFTYKGESVDVKQIGEELGARYVVEGSVRRAENRVRIGAQLIDATTGHHLWAERYDRELRDVFAVQDEIVLAIADEIGIATDRSEQARVARRDPQSLDAWECASRAGWHFGKFRRDDNAAARSLWERASELDPLWVWPHQAVAVTHLVDLGRLWTSRPDESVAAIVQAAERAVALDEQDPWAQLARGIASWVTGQLHEQIAAFQRAARLGPNITSAHLFLGMALTQANRPEEALTSLGRVVTLSPRDFQVPLVRSWEGLAHFAAGRYDEAIGALRLSIDLDPQHPQPYHALAASLAELGRIDEAQSALRDAHRLRPDFSLAKAEQTWPILGPHIREHFLAGLRKAGLE